MISIQIQKLKMNYVVLSKFFVNNNNEKINKLLLMIFLERVFNMV
jgi:hypothetical protein